MPGKSFNISRRSVLAAGSAGALGALAAGAAGAQGLPGPSEVDIGRVENGKVRFPEWRGAGDRPSSPPPAPLPDEKRVGFAVVGLGRLSLERILPAFAESRMAKPVALVSGTPDKARAVAEQYGIAPDAIYDYESMGRMAENAAIRAAYVVTPNGLHRRDTLAAAAAGKHVLCEKPMAISSAQARDMIAACRDASVKLMIAYRCQYEPYNRRASALLRSGDFGRPRLIEAVNTQVEGTGDQWRFRKALAGGGALPDIGLYCLNAARFYTGEEPDEVFARIHSPADDARYSEVEETVTFTLRFPSGLLANCATSYGAHESRAMRLHMPQASIEVPNAFAYNGQRLVVSRRSGDDEERGEISLEPRNQFASEIDHFATCIIENLLPRTPGEEGLQDHVIMEAIYRSAETGAPVRLQTLGDKADPTRGTIPENG